MSVCKETLFIRPPGHEKSNYLSVNTRPDKAGPVCRPLKNVLFRRLTLFDVRQPRGIHSILRSESDEIHPLHGG
jgi:hypothetical protein